MDAARKPSKEPSRTSRETVQQKSKEAAPDARAGYAYIWRYQVRPEKTAEFEELYGPRGGWARLFSKSRHYCGTELLTSGPGWYWTVDRWTSRQAHKSFVQAHQAEFEELDKRGESLTVSEEQMGEFKIVGRRRK